MNKSDSIKELATALSAAQLEIENASKNAANPHFRSKYADLAEVLNTVRPVFAKHGLGILQFPSYENGTASVETVLTHSSGEFITGISSCHVTKDDAQGVGSATTYLRRYSLAAVAGVAQEDDDAESAIGRGKQAANKAPVKSVVITLVSEEQAANLEALATEVGADTKAFLSFAGANSFSAIKADAYDNLVKALEAKRAKAA